MIDIKAMLLGIVLVLMGRHVIVLGNDHYGNIMCLFGYIVAAVGLILNVTNHKRTILIRG